MLNIRAHVAAGFIAAALVISPVSLVHAQSGVEREGRHTHAGTLVGQVQEGELTLEQEGLATRTYKAGDSFSVKPGQVHEGINKGSTPIKALVTFVAEKGK